MAGVLAAVPARDRVSRGPVVLTVGDGRAPALRPGDVDFEAFLSKDDQLKSVERDPHDAINVLFLVAERKIVHWSGI